MKNVLSNLFGVKELVNHLKKEPSENQPNDLNKTDNKKPNNFPELTNKKANSRYLILNSSKRKLQHILLTKPPQ